MFEVVVSYRRGLERVAFLDRALAVIAQVNVDAAA